MALMQNHKAPHPRSGTAAQCPLLAQMRTSNLISVRSRIRDGSADTAAHLAVPQRPPRIRLRQRIERDGRVVPLAEGSIRRPTAGRDLVRRQVARRQVSLLLVAGGRRFICRLAFVTLTSSYAHSRAKPAVM